MTLSWQLEKIQDNETVCWIIDPETGNRRMNPITNAIIWYSMALDIGDLVPRNVDEWYIRMWIHDKLFQPLTGPPNRKVTLEELIAHQGLRTHVVTRTRNQWLNRMKLTLYAEAISDLHKAKKEMLDRANGTVGTASH